jgi:HAD superfamily hydrolase (TIGR01490 family)
LQVFVFDLDKTLIKTNSSFEFCLFLYRKKFFSILYVFRSVLYYLKHRFMGMTLSELHEQIFRRVLKGKDLQMIVSHVKEFVDEWLAQALYMPAIAELRRAQHLGYYTMILSNSPSFIVKIIAERLSVVHWQGTEYAVDKDGKLSKIARILNGRDKAFYVRDFIKKLGMKKNQVVAYSDSIWDLPLLKAAGHVVVVNPDRKLQKISQKKNWVMI